MPSRFRTIYHVVRPDLQADIPVGVPSEVKILKACPFTVDGTPPCYGGTVWHPDSAPQCWVV